MFMTNQSIFSVLKNTMNNTNETYLTQLNDLKNLKIEQSNLQVETNHISNITTKLKKEIEKLKIIKKEITNNKKEIDNQRCEIEHLQEEIKLGLNKFLSLLSQQSFQVGNSSSPPPPIPLFAPKIFTPQIDLQTLKKFATGKGKLTKVSENDSSTKEELVLQEIRSYKVSIMAKETQLKQLKNKFKDLFIESATEKAKQVIYQQILERQHGEINTLSKKKENMEKKLKAVKERVAFKSKNEEKKIEESNSSGNLKIFSPSAEGVPSYLKALNTNTSSQKYFEEMERKKEEKEIKDFLINKLIDIVIKLKNKELEEVDFSENLQKLVDSMEQSKLFELREILIKTKKTVTPFQMQALKLRCLFKGEGDAVELAELKLIKNNRNKPEIKNVVSKFIDANEQCTATLKSVAKEIINQENLTAQRTLEAQKEEEDIKRVKEEIKRAEAKKIEEEEKAAERQKLLSELGIVEHYVNPDNLKNEQLELEKNAVLGKEALDQVDFFLKDVDFKLEAVVFQLLLNKLNFDQILNNFHNKNQALSKKGYSEAAEEAWSIYEKLTSNKKKLLEQKINVNQFVE
ncbi:hypothetical protein, partial [Legionella sp.]|uniref:hypothetical protein n=1 Tax=Legionella sp. TaxID=459 RepID=UPI003CB74CEC